MQHCCRATDRKRVEKRINSLSASCLMQAFYLTFTAFSHLHHQLLSLTCISKGVHDTNNEFICRAGKNELYCAKYLCRRAKIQFFAFTRSHSCSCHCQWINQAKFFIKAAEPLSMQMWHSDQALSLSLCQREYKVITALI